MSVDQIMDAHMRKYFYFVLIVLGLISQPAFSSQYSSEELASFAAKCADKHFLDLVYSRSFPNSANRSELKTGFDESKLVYWSGTESVGGLPSCSTPKGEKLDSYVRTHALEIINDEAISIFTKGSKFRPSAKETFEKSSDYEARIAKDKAEHDRKTGNSSVSNILLEKVWQTVLGKPVVYRGKSGDKLNPTYDADSEEFRLNVVSAIGANTGNPAVIIPVSIKMNTDKARMVLNAVTTEVDKDSGFNNDPIVMAKLDPYVAMQFVNGILTVKNISLLLYSAKDEASQETVRSLLANIPVNYSFDFTFGK